MNVQSFLVAVTASLMLIAGMLPIPAFAQADAPAAEPVIKPGTSEELAVGDLVFQVTSLRVSAPESDHMHFSIATISLQVRNAGDTPQSLCMEEMSARITNDLGYVWGSSAFRNKVTGVCLATQSKASTDYTVAPGKTLRLQLQLPLKMSSGQTIGGAYDFAADFSSYRNLGEGKLEIANRYPVSFVGLRRSGALAGATDDLQGQVDSAKQKLNSLFGH